MNGIDVNPRVDQSGTAMMREYIGIASRNRWHILACVASSLVLAWMYCIFAPQFYRSETLILAEEEQEMLDSVIQGGGEGHLEQRIYLIQRQIMSPEFLGPIAREFHLYPEHLSPQEEDASIRWLANAITVEM